MILSFSIFRKKYHLLWPIEKKKKSFEKPGSFKSKLHESQLWGGGGVELDELISIHTLAVEEPPPILELSLEDLLP